MNNKDADKAAQIRRLICVFVASGFLMTRPKCKKWASIFWIQKRATAVFGMQVFILNGLLKPILYSLLYMKQYIAKYHKTYKNWNTKTVTIIAIKCHNEIL